MMHPRLSSAAPTRPPRRVLVVGATGLLGTAIASALATRGDRVIATARDDAKLQALLAALNGTGHRHITADLREPGAPETVHDAIVAAGGVDDLVLACGPFPRTPFETLTREELESTLSVHAIAPLLIASSLAPYLRASEGAILALGDAGVARPFENHVAYLTAKGALQTGLRALALELAPHVRVNVLALGVVADEEADADPLRTHRLRTRTPLGRFGRPHEVVHAALALLDATWATGEIWGVGR